jgi:hypothetical protein
LHWKGRERSVQDEGRTGGGSIREKEGDEDHRDGVGEDESDFCERRRNQSQKRSANKQEERRTLRRERTEQTLTELRSTVAAAVRAKKIQVGR